MIYKINEPVSAKAISDLRASVGWNRMVDSYKNPLLTSYINISVFDNNKLIAYIDSVSNGVTDAYIQDLMVHPDYQEQGIGTELMNRIIALLKQNHIYMISVIFDENLKEFYNRFGFQITCAGQMQTFECE